MKKEVSFKTFEYGMFPLVNSSGDLGELMALIDEVNSVSMSWRHPGASSHPHRTELTTARVIVGDHYKEFYFSTPSLEKIGAFEGFLPLKNLHQSNLFFFFP